MAVHGQALLEAAVVVPDLLTAINDCRRTVGSCGRLDHGDIPLQTPEQALGWLLASDGKSSRAGAPMALVFGREDRGLSNSELRLCQRVLCLQSGEAYPSLNLSHAVAVVLHELARLRSGTTATPSIEPPSRTQPPPKPPQPVWTTQRTCCWRPGSCWSTPQTPAWPRCGSAATRHCACRGSGSAAGDGASTALGHPRRTPLISARSSRPTG